MTDKFLDEYRTILSKLSNAQLVDIVIEKNIRLDYIKKENSAIRAELQEIEMRKKNMSVFDPIFIAIVEAVQGMECEECNDYMVACGRDEDVL